MPDVLMPEQRHLNMSRIRAKDTKPEMILRRGLHARGLRYRLHQHNLPGRPDLVFASRKAVIFVHGCFWHGHGCHLFVWPATRREFWRKKISNNQKRDIRNVEMLRAAGWRVFVLWECALRGSGRLAFEDVLERVELFVIGNRNLMDLKGRKALRKDYNERGGAYVKNRNS